MADSDDDRENSSSRGTIEMSQSGSSDSVIMESIHASRIAEIIRKGDPVRLDKFMASLSLEPATYYSGFGTILHAAAAFGNRELFENYLRRGVDLNATSSNGETALHVASRLGRHELLEMLMVHPDIDDTLRDNHGKTALDVAKNKQIASTLEYMRNVAVARKTKEMLAAGSRGDENALRALLDGNSRNRALLDVNTADGHGDSILHLASRSDKLGLVRYCLELGCDPFLKNGKGKVPLELAKDETVKAVLREAPMIQSKELPLGRSVRLEGYLSKWTNYAAGYKRRWFILEDGILAYYKTQAEYPISCRGSVNVQFVRVVLNPNDRFRFEVRGIDNPAIHYHLRADNAGDAKRWVIGINHARAMLRHEFDSTDALDSCISTPAAGDRKGSVVLNNIPYEDQVRNILQSSKTQLDVYENLIVNLRDYLTSSPARDLDRTRILAAEFYSAAHEINNTLRECLATLEERESYWLSRFDHEAQQKQMLEESLRALAVENNQMEQWTRRTRAKTALRSGMNFEETDEFFDAIDLEAEEDLKNAMELDALVEVEFVPKPDLDFIQKSLLGYPKPEAIRTTLSFSSKDIPSVSLWSIIRNAIGHDLTRIPIPVNFCEPLSMLQRLCEDMEYAELLDIAVSRSDPFQRIQYVAAFAASSYSSTDGRVSKPFNPLLGETFEYVSAEKGFRYVSEQVSHHPPITACHCESACYVYWSEVRVRSKFWGKSLEAIPEGVSHLLLKATGEHFSWKKVTTGIHNIIVGKLWIDHYGTLTVTNHATGDSCSLEFKPTGWRATHAKRVEGVVKDSFNIPRYSISGHWNQILVSTNLLSNEVFELWRRRPLLPQSYDHYNFSAFTFALNELSEELRAAICPTDSRFRPDQRAMEVGDFEDANALKVALEERQRAVRRAREADPAASDHKPQWFRKELEPDTGEEHWVFCNDYWSHRERHCWPAHPSIFLD